MVSAPDTPRLPPGHPHRSTHACVLPTPSAHQLTPSSVAPANGRTPSASHPIPSSAASRLSHHLVTPSQTRPASPYPPRYIPLLPSPPLLEPRQPHDRGDIQLPANSSAVKLPRLKLAPQVPSYSTPRPPTLDRKGRDRQISPSEQVWRMGCCRNPHGPSARLNTAPGPPSRPSNTNGRLFAPLPPITPTPPHSGSLLHHHLTSPSSANGSPKSLPSVLQPYGRHRLLPQQGAPPTPHRPVTGFETSHNMLQPFSSDLAFKDARGTRLPLKHDPSWEPGRWSARRPDTPRPMSNPPASAETPMKGVSPADPASAQRRRSGKGEPKWKKSVCDICHIKKTKCDRALPACQVCVERGYPCHYSEPGEIPTLPADVVAGKYKIPRKGMDTGLHRQGYVTIISPSHPGETIRIPIPEPPISGVRSTQGVNTNEVKDTNGPPAKSKDNGSTADRERIAHLLDQAVRKEAGIYDEAKYESRVLYRFWKKRHWNEKRTRIRAWVDKVSGSEEESSLDQGNATPVKRRRQTGEEDRE